MSIDIFSKLQELLSMSDDVDLLEILHQDFKSAVLDRDYVYATWMTRAAFWRKAGRTDVVGAEKALDQMSKFLLDRIRVSRFVLTRGIAIVFSDEQGDSLIGTIVFNDSDSIE